MAECLRLDKFYSLQVLLQGQQQYKTISMVF